ncbi:DUF4411 family protein [Lactobacillus kefiranofaciens]|uniref:DUF4411 family protein n=2 Tax=Lactobacillus TaxID=1578 RepID=A0AAX3UG18_9LACO|nr:DUF4411 family protein [Lactobacillus kefiranofaciens]AEG40038.1 Hypothetical protein WANG_0343 [Lactobacillus kefiranofaciens subsp. kefiranofaciens]KRM23241.1 hypothetical protein FC93_GL000226 [Lactobacillus kefiranofaciens subsp. kefiranofaciens DSM 5016 = JCM 6985]WGO86621.1 DUF4411 family protein [Lactobacillus kefiranofaciens]WQH36060.1 DUF4411 family protein [Lactobacillus kefiranofaciens]SDA37023.1 protein of unknown function [Lactobacillus kefiranofaciens]
MVKYLLDSNCFIEPMKRYYSFKAFPSYWKWLNEELNKENSLLVISKCVADEINVDPRLEKWTQEHFSNLVYDKNRDPFVWSKYAEIINYVQNCGAYQTGSVNEWKKPGKADPLLIAIASQYNYQIVTFERESGQFGYDVNNEWNWKHNGGPIRHEPKIPDIAKHFGVSCITLFDLEEKLKLCI